ncbi:MAG: hypothetical protein KBH15_04670 [Candidatus Atribacteria bacterium]|nr:hypothetical protein [Candidatus Atribacteria bacterium]
MKRYKLIGIMLIFLLFVSLPAGGQEKKVVITEVKAQELAGNIFISIQGEIQAEGEGSVFLQAFTTYEDQDYFTAPQEIKYALSQEGFSLSLSGEDFQLIDLRENKMEKLPQLAEGQNVVIYVYEKKITSPEGQTEEVKKDIEKVGYALRGILAKVTLTLGLKE